MNPVNYPLRIRKGAPLDVRVSWRNDDGSPIDLTSYKASLQIRRTPEDAEPVEDWVDGPGGEITLGADGTVQVWVDGKATKALGWKAGVYDLVLSQDGVEPIRLLEGTAEVT